MTRKNAINNENSKKQWLKMKTLEKKNSGENP